MSRHPRSEGEGAPPPSRSPKKTSKVQRRGRAASLLTAESALIGLGFGLAVVAPWLSGGYVLLLDWVSGPHQAVSPGLYGLDPAALDAMPYRMATQLIREVLGPKVTAWLLILLYFPIAAGGASALAGGGRFRRYTAALFVCCNPFVLERIRAGHVSFLLSTAVLTWLFASAVQAKRRGKPFAARPAGWYALAVTIGPHGAWLGGLGLLAVAVLPRPHWKDAFRTALIVISAGAVYLYAAAVLVSGVPVMRVSELDLDAYATRAGPGGLLPTVASLRGFWRGWDGLPKDRVGPAIGFAVLAVLLAGVLTGLVLLGRRDATLGAPLAAIIAGGLVLGAGVNGPVGSVYRWAFGVVPLFEAMREQQKWLALAMIGYAVALGGAVEGVVYAVRRHRRGVRRAVLVTAGLVVGASTIATAPSLVWGLGGTVHASRYPADWYAADRLMGVGPEAVLFLPWHGYQPFAFTRERTIATPATAFFSRPVLSSDSVELGQLRTNSVSRRIAYVDRLIADGGGERFGRLVAPLGVGYVLLARDRDADAYGWLDSQVDLEPVLRADRLTLYKVKPMATGRVVAARTVGYADALSLARADKLGTEALLQESEIDPAVEDPGDAPLPASAYGNIRRETSTRWRVQAGPSGWVTIPEEWSPGWKVNGEEGHPTVAGTVAVKVGAGPAIVEYEPWRWLRVGLTASLLTLAALVTAGLVEHRRELQGWWARRSHWKLLDEEP